MRPPSDLPPGVSHQGIKYRVFYSCMNPNCRRKKYSVLFRESMGTAIPEGYETCPECQTLGVHVLSLAERAIRFFEKALATKVPPPGEIIDREECEVRLQLWKSLRDDARRQTFKNLRPFYQGLVEEWFEREGDE